MEVLRLRSGLSALSALVCLLGQGWDRRGDKEVSASLTLQMGLGLEEKLLGRVH